MARTRNLEVVISGDARDLERAFKRAGDSADRNQRKITGFASVTSKGFSRVGAAASGMGAVAGGAVALLAKSTVDAASDINESLTKNQRLFGQHAAAIERWSRSTARSIGIGRREALAAAGSFGSLFQTIGLADRPAASMSRRFVQLAADLASFNNASPTEALDALRSGLIGEAEPMRRFGALLSETRVKQEAYRSGIARVGSELTEQQKVQARYNLILRDTRQAQGDFARTSGGLANQQRILKARLSDVQAEIGSKLLPAVLRGAQGLNRFIDGMRRGTGAGGDFARELRKFANDMRNAYEAGQALYRGGQRVNSWLQSADRAVGRLDASINRGLVSGFNRVVSAGAKVVSTVRTIVGWLGKIKVPDINLPFGLGGTGDGPGLPSLPNLTGVGAGNLMGAQSALAPFAAVGSRFGLHVSSGRRPGSITSSGNVSYHSTGEAIDEAGSPGGMMGFFRYMKSRFGSRLAELIYTPGGSGIKDGRPFTYTGQVAADHFDHVHVAFDTGRPGVGDGPGRTRKGELGWLNEQWARIAPLWGMSAKSSLGGLFKHVKLSGASPFVGVSTDPGAGMDTAELLWPSWLWRGGKGQKPLDDRTKLKLFIHEMSHRFQAPGAIHSEWESEGGAEAFARIAMDRSFGGYPKDRHDPYNPFVTKVMKERGWGWVTGGQFGTPGRKAGTGDGIGQAASAARAAGFRGQALVTALAIAGAESRFNPRAQNLKYPDHSIGLWQINQLAHRGRFGSDAALMNPTTNARAAFALSGGGRNWGPWTTFTSGAYRGYLARARAAAVGSRGSRPTASRPAPAPARRPAATAPRPSAPARGNSPGRFGPSWYRAPTAVDASPIDTGAGDAGFAGEGGDPNQGLIDAINAKAEQDRQLAEEAAARAEEQRRAIEEHTAALNALKDEEKRQTDLAARVAGTTTQQIGQALFDLMSGQIVGPGVIRRAFTPGSGTEYAW